MDATVRDLATITDLAGESRKLNEQHSKVGPRDMLARLKTKRKRGRGTVLNVGRGMAMWSQCIGWPI